MTRVTMVFCGLVIALATAAQADITTWTGNSGTSFTAAGSWTGIVPRDSDWYDTARFANTSPANKTPTLGSNRDVFSIQFDNSTGWTLGPAGRSLTLRKVSSTGAGANTVTAQLKSMYSNYTWTLGPGNTLNLAGGLYQTTGDSIIKLTGGGTLSITGSIDGWSSGLQMHVEDGTLRINGSTPYVNGGAVHLNSATAALQLNTSVAAAEALIGTKIVDGTGAGLAVTDLGGGFVEIAADTSDPMPPIAGNWNLTFEDEFNSPDLDGTKWRVGQHFAGSLTAGGLSPQNVSVANGVLKLLAEQRQSTFAGQTKSYAMGEVSTFFNFRQEYGYFEARIKYPAVKGLWPAFWLMPNRARYGDKDLYRRSYLKFELQSVNPGTVTSAQLKLKVKAKQSGVDHNLLVLPLADDSWTEDDITWNNKPTPDPRWIGHRWNNEIVVGQDLVIDVTDFVAQEMSGDKVISLVLADTFMKQRAITLHSRETTVQADRPRLVINGSTYYVDKDAYVRWGEYDDDNFGNEEVLVVKDDYQDNPTTASTYSGGMEIDIMESLGVWGTNRTQHGLHWDEYGNDHQHVNSGQVYYPGGPADDFHTYGLLWEEDGYRFYIDGQETWSWYNPRTMSVPAFMILSLQVGGWGGSGNGAGAQVDGKVMEVDWVRVWSGTPTLAPFARWPLNNNANDAIGNIDATLQNGAAYSTNAEEGSHSLSLDGVNDYVLLSAKESANPLHNAFSQRSVSFWMKADTTSGTRVLFDEGAYGKGFAVRLSNNQIEAIARSSPDDSATVTSGFFSSTAWTHVAVTYSGSALKLYINGVQAGSTSTSLGEIGAHIGAAGLGASVEGSAFNAYGDNSTGQYFDGLIDDVRVYSSALTVDDVEALAGL